ncbi:hypothetical protein MK489_03680 [Myxococcota bacterium]|nr:hypothetical protein [Myxococcota bacterium]
MLSAGRSVVTAWAFALTCAAGCASVSREVPRPAAVIQQHFFGKGEGVLGRVAVMPLQAKLPVALRGNESQLGSAEAALQLTSYFSEALSARGVAIVSAHDLQIAADKRGIGLLQTDVRAVAKLAASEFGATGLVHGELLRYRDRVGESLGSSRPASVAFTVTLYEAPTGFALWTGRFDETQRALSENVFNARRYPGGGLRWLTSTELARWGMAEAVTALVNRP